MKTTCKKSWPLKNFPNLNVVANLVVPAPFLHHVADNEKYFPVVMFQNIGQRYCVVVNKIAMACVIWPSRLSAP